MQFHEVWRFTACTEGIAGHAQFAHFHTQESLCKRDKSRSSDELHQKIISTPSVVSKENPLLIVGITLR